MEIVNMMYAIMATTMFGNIKASENTSVPKQRIKDGERTNSSFIKKERIDASVNYIEAFYNISDVDFSLFRNANEEKKERSIDMIEHCIEAIIKAKLESEDDSEMDEFDELLKKAKEISDGMYEIEFEGSGDGEIIEYATELHLRIDYMIEKSKSDNPEDIGFAKRLISMLSDLPNFIEKELTKRINKKGQKSNDAEKKGIVCLKGLELK
eukprot:GHVP01050737.1.p1 GENE.GHVP01050737.1~~GHVP01050737.1.p1  ORF type:complete len:210 (+),score=58.98 GHVP01050737.1:2-631(+)